MKRFSMLLAASLIIASGCRPATPTVICQVRNPTTGQSVKLFEEIPYKVPADYDEAKHIAEWKAEQAKRGFTEQIEPTE